jgi:hypothetical protein
MVPPIDLPDGRPEKGALSGIFGDVAATKPDLLLGSGIAI